ncbi:MAG: hypothetical protein H6627_04395 [Calditrichae bacterium]|nr:hypothetical protein [Calditrichia bacterium]
MKDIFMKTLFILLLIVIGLSFAQTENHVPSSDRGNDLFKRNSNLDGNNLRTTIHNYGVKGVSGDTPDQHYFEWPKNTGREHIYFVSFWVAGKVISESGEEITIVDLADLRQDPNNAEVSWTFLPVEGYLNPNEDEIARSDNEDTWPTSAQGGWRDKRDDADDPGWIGKWNGFFGKDKFNADQEMFYRASDDSYDRFIKSGEYFPDDTDQSRGGLGLLFDFRALVWTQILVNDVQFFIYDVLNDGTKRIPKTVFTFWMADLMGGDPDDDINKLDLKTDIAFFIDEQYGGTDPWEGGPVGIGGVKLLETPGNQVDGIDNDGDADEHPELILQIKGDPDVRVPLFSERDFAPTFKQPGDSIVLIDSLTLERRVVAYPENGGIVKSLGFTYNLPAEGVTLHEDSGSVVFKDDDLDGLIDEARTLHLERFNTRTGIEEPVRYINYLSFSIGDTIKRGFVVAGKAAEWNYENVAPMIDESRDDGFDNDGDWDLTQDDVGLDGTDSNDDPNIFADTGERDGIPTSGSGTGFPGEPNIDKTDVSETDLIGLAGAAQAIEGTPDLSSADRRLFDRYMEPQIFDFVPPGTRKTDLWISSGYFPMEPGERQRLAVAVTMADGGADQKDETAAIENLSQAQKAYEIDYRFAKAPLQVTVTAVPGDGKVTLYWDDIAESSVDDFIKRQNGPYEDFEGYRIYRSTDAAFTDPKIITNADGVPTLLKPIAIFDKEDGIFGYHPVPINGVQYTLSQSKDRESGLQHTFIDSGLTNGQRYYYAVTAYDFGYAAANIAPSETPIRIDVDLEGNIATGTNVVVVTPRAPVAGYEAAKLQSFDHVLGTTTADVKFEVVDPRAIEDGHEYEITFQDTLKKLGTKELRFTKNFTLVDLTDQDTLINKSTQLSEKDASTQQIIPFEQPVTEGFQLSLFNLPIDEIRVNYNKSHWSSDSVFDYDFSPFINPPIIGVTNPNDYQIIFGDVGIGRSKDTTALDGSIKVPLPARDVNFKIVNTSTGEPVEFAFIEFDGSNGEFSINPNESDDADLIIFLENDPSGKLVWTWQLILNTQPVYARNPQSGDTLSVFVTKPFQSLDVFRFKMAGEKENKAAAKADLKNIRVVPNPYIAAASWEPRNTYNSGPGPREIHFINLPAKCTIRIFSVSGELVDKIEHDSKEINQGEINGFTLNSDSGLNNGTAVWDMLSKDNLEIAYGVYVYHIDAPGIGQKTGTFAIIK